MKFLLSLLIFFSLQSIFSQEVHLYCIAFYNVENLFDINDNPNTFDDDYTPKGRNQWTLATFNQKIDQLASVISGIGIEETHNAPLLLGLAEIENRHVLEALVAHPKLRPYGYGIVHFDSPDFRGIDVALLYQKERFNLSEAKTYRLELIDSKTQFKKTTRDQLVVSGYLNEDLLHVLVNHWPSRRGGERRSQSSRMAAAYLQRRIIDSLQGLDTDAKIISMGDYNDDPTNKSLQLLVKQDPKSYLKNFKPLFNPMERLYKMGLGSLAHNDRWHLFDQLLISKVLLDSEELSLIATKLFNPPFLRTPDGNYQGYPFRVRRKGMLLDGFSDHFPVYSIFAKPL